MSDPVIVQVETPAENTAVTDTQAGALEQATEAAADIAAAAAAVAQAAAISPENRLTDEMRAIWERLGTLDSGLSELREKMDNVLQAIELLAVAEAAEVAEEIAEENGDTSAAESAQETQAAAAMAAETIAAEDIPAVTETPQIRAKSSRRFV